MRWGHLSGAFHSALVNLEFFFVPPNVVSLSVVVHIWLLPWSFS